MRSQERTEQPDSKLLSDWHRPLVPGTSLRLEAPPHTHTPLGASASKAAEPPAACVLLHPVSSLACHRSPWDLWRVVGKRVPALAGPWRYSRHQTRGSKRLVAGGSLPGGCCGESPGPGPPEAQSLSATAKKQRATPLPKCSNPPTTLCTSGEQTAANTCTQHPALPILRCDLIAGHVRLLLLKSEGNLKFSLTLPQLEYFSHLCPVQALFYPPK